MASRAPTRQGAAPKARGQPNLALHRLHRRDQRPQPHIDQIDVRHGQRDVAMNHHSAVEQAIDQIDKRDLARLPGVLDAGYRAGNAHRAASIEPFTKLYGGHGPVSSTDTPCERYSSSSSSTRRLNSSALSSSTR